MLLAITDMPKVGTELSLDISSFVGSLVFLWLVQLLFPLSLSVLVYEKQQRLRLMMRMHGLSNAVYFFVTYLYLISLYMVYIFVMILVGSLVGLGFFRNNSYRALPSPLFSSFAQPCSAALFSSFRALPSSLGVPG